MDSNTGYQQAILFLLGYWQEKRYLVRCVDKHYIDTVAPLFERTRPFLQHRTGEGKKDYWCIKSSAADNFTPPTLADVEDWPAFSRAVVELQGIVDLRKVSSHGVPQRRLRLRIYGKPDLLESVCSRFPAKPKKMQLIKTNNGETHAFFYQSPAEVCEILDYLDGEPRNEGIWKKWNELREGSSKHER